MQLTPITPTLGATIEGVDLHRCSAGEIAALRTALLRHKVLFVRDQRLDLDQLHAASARFGDLMKLPYIAPTKTHPAIIEVRKEADEINMGVFGGDWHSDFSFLSAPPALSILMASE
ncbi:MAG: TauD/TfdA family dioxygenase, partial [Pseudomonadota bacterium]